MDKTFFLAMIAAIAGLAVHAVERPLRSLFEEENS